MSETLSPKTTVAQYTIVSKIGEGGMGRLYLAHDSRLDRNVALKILPAELAALEVPLQNSNRQFSEALKRNRIEHTFEVFEGGHTDKARERIETKMPPFFSRRLVSQNSGPR